MRHTILIADSVNSCALMSALYKHLDYSTKSCGTTAVNGIEDISPSSFVKHQHPHFRLLVSKEFTFLYIKDLSAAGTNQYSSELQAYVCEVLMKRLDELSAHCQNMTVYIIALTEQSTMNHDDKAQLLVLGSQAPPTDITVTGMGGMVYEWCHFNRSKYSTLKDLQCAIILLRHPGAPIYPYSEYAEMYLSSSVLKAAGVPHGKELRKRIEEIVQTYMNAISLVYI